MLRQVSEDDDYEQDEDFEEEAASAPWARSQPSPKLGRGAEFKGAFASATPASRSEEAAGETTVELRELEDRVNARLALLERVKRRDVHTASWEGDVEVVRAHLELAGSNAARQARSEVRKAKRNLESLSREAATMSKDLGGEADEAEVSVAYVEKLDALEESVRAAEAALARAEALGAAQAANVVDTTEFGDGYRPLHYAAYNGQLAVVRALLDFGGRPDEANAAGATPLFLAAQQGHDDIVALLLKDEGSSFCDASRLVPTGDGRKFCALDVCRAEDRRLPNRANCRALLLDTLASRPRRSKVGVDCTSDDRPLKPPQPPRLFPAAAAASAEPTTAPLDAKYGGVQITWNEEHYEPRPGAEYAAPRAHHVKVRLLDDDGNVAAVFVCRSATHSARVFVQPAAATSQGLDDDLSLLSMRGGPDSVFVKAGAAYAAQIAAVNAVAAGAYSDPSDYVRASAPKKTKQHNTRVSLEQQQQQQQQHRGGGVDAAKTGTAEDSGKDSLKKPPVGRGVDPKIVRARRAVAEGRAKRQRFAEMLATESGSAAKTSARCGEEKRDQVAGFAETPHFPRSPSDLGGGASLARMEEDDVVEAVGPVVSLAKFAPPKQFVDLEASGPVPAPLGLPGSNLVSPTTSPLGGAPVEKDSRGAFRDYDS